MKRLKLLCLCSQGNNRSVMIGALSKDYGWDAIAAGVDANDPSTIGILSHWADYIWVAQERMKDKLDPSVHDKIVMLPVGDDIWGYSPHPDLHKKAKNEIFPALATEVRRRVDKEMGR